MLAPDEHPDQPTLQAFISGRIDDDGLQRDLETHVDACDSCAARIGQLSIDATFLHIGEQSNGNHDSNDKDTVRTPSLVGSWLGKYRISKLIGRGGMGAVYQADDTVLNRRVAIKTLLQPTVDERDVMNRLIDEAQAAGAIAHPNVATVYDFVSDADLHCLVMEYLAGGSVADLITSSSMNWQEAVRLLGEACQGIDAAHRRGILHRDIKPANLLLTRDRQVKVGDFGLALQCTQPNSQPTGTIAGTVHFMSPEQCRDESLDPRSDIYSIGATLYTLLTGQPPYQNFDSAEQIVFAHSHAPIPDPRRVDADIPSACAAIAMRALSKNPDDRYASCGELLDDLSSLSSSAKDPKSSDRRWRQFARIPTGPTVVVVPPECLTDSDEDQLLAGGIACEINSRLSQFQNLRVVAHRTAAQKFAEQLTGEALKRELSADYVIGGTIQRLGNRLRLTAALSSTSDSSTIWNERFDRTLTDENLFDIQDEIAEHVSSKLAQPYGEFHRAERTKVGEHDDLNAYSVVLRFYDYWHRESLDDYWPVRDALADVVERLPDYAAAHAALALMLVNAVRLHRLPDHEDALELAVDHAQRALRLDPKLEMAHQAAVTSQFHLGNRQQFLIAAEKALEAYPNHCELLADIGLFFTVSGNAKRGVPLARKAIAISPDPPAWYFSALVVNAFLMSEFDLALEFSRRVGTDHVWGRLHHAVSLGHLRRIDEAAVHLEGAEAFVPGLATQLDSMLSFFHVTDELRTVFVDGLTRAGLNAE